MIGMALRRFGLILLVAWSLSTPGAMGQEAASPKSIVVGINKDFPPFEYLDAKGQPAGYDVDLIRQAAAEVELEVVFKADTWDQIRSDVMAGRVDAVPGMIFSKERAEFVDFSAPHLLIHYCLFVRQGTKGIRSIEDLRGRKILVEQGSRMHELLLAKGFAAELLPVVSEPEALRALAGGTKADTAILPRLQGLEMIRDLHLKNVRPLAGSIDSQELCIAVAKGRGRLLARLESGLSILYRTGKYQEIYDTWLGPLEVERGIPRHLLRILGWSALALFGVVALVLAWSWSLARQVRQRTRALQESRGRLQAVFDASNDAFFIHDPKTGAILDVNRRACEMYGSPREELLSLDIEDLSSGIHPYGREEALAWIQRTAGGSPQVFQWQAKDLYGHLFWVEVNMRRGTLEGHDCVVACVRDITPRIQAEQQMREAMEFNEKLLAHMAIGHAVYHGRTGECVRVNDAIVNIVGGDREYHLSRNFRTIDKWKQTGLLEAAELALKTGEYQHREVYVTTSTGRTCWLSCHFSTFQISGETHLIVLTQDITEHHQADAALKASESRLQSIFNSSLALITVTRLSDGRIIEINDAFSRTTEWSREEVLGKTTQEISIWAVPEDRDRMLKCVSEQDRLQNFETRLLTRSGEARNVIMNGEVICFGDEPHLVIFSNDVTEGRKTEASLRRAYAALEQSPAMVLITDPKAVIEYVNDACLRITGYTKTELVGQTPRILKSGEMSLEFYQQLWGTLNRGEVWHGRFHNRRKDGFLYWEQATISPIRDENGRTTHFVAIKEDITEMLRLESERKDLDRKLSQAQRLESLGSLAGGVAHDMNNVLGAILSIASLHEAKASEGSPLRKGMETIEKACIRGRTLVQGLLGFARQDLAEERILDLNMIIREEVSLLERTTLQKVNLEMYLAEDLRPVMGDPSSLSHALMNLCVNAVDAMPEGGRLILRTKNSGADSIRIEVADTGLGMSPETVEKALDPFFTTKPQGKGTGLGLPMVYGTVKAHKGDMEIESRVGEGTTVRLTLPACLQQPAAPPAERAPEAEKKVLRILLVDDDELIQLSTGELLETLGHHVSIAGRGEEALELLAKGLEIDGVILDLNMPGMGGAAALPKIREERPRVPIFLATGRADQDAMDLVGSVPGTTLLAKPYTLKDLRELLQKL